MSQYKTVLHEFLEERGSRDLLRILEPLYATTYATAANAELLLKFSDLAAQLIRLNRNTLCSHVKLKDAMKQLHAERPCLYGTRAMGVELDQASLAIRTMLSKWRILKQDPEKARVVMAKVIKPVCRYVNLKVIPIYIYTYL